MITQTTFTLIVISLCLLSVVGQTIWKWRVDKSLRCAKIVVERPPFFSLKGPVMSEHEQPLDSYEQLTADGWKWDTNTTKFGVAQLLVEWRRNSPKLQFKVGGPKSTDMFSAADLEFRGMVGVYSRDGKTSKLDAFPVIFPDKSAPSPSSIYPYEAPLIDDAIPEGAVTLC